MQFLVHLASLATKAAWADLGTNGLGWFVSLASPLLVAVRGAWRAPRGRRLKTLKKSWKTELRDAFFLALSFALLIFAIELIFRQPALIKEQSASIQPPPLLFRTPGAPETTYSRREAASGASKLEIVNVVDVPLQKRNNPNEKGHALNIFYANRGTIPASFMSHRLVFRASASPLSREDEEESQRISLNGPAPEPDTQEVDINPGDLPKHFFSFPDNDDQIAAFTEVANAVLAGKMRIYVFVTLKYLDQNVPRKQMRVTAFCGWFQDNFDMWHNCGMNRTYMTALR